MASPPLIELYKQKRKFAYPAHPPPRIVDCSPQADLAEHALRLEQIRAQSRDGSGDSGFYERPQRARRTRESVSCLTTWRGGGNSRRARGRAGENRAQSEVREEENKAKRAGSSSCRLYSLASSGLMDVRVSTLRARFLRRRFATKEHLDPLPGRSGCVSGSLHQHGICRALSDDGSLTGRGTPWIRASSPDP